MSDSVETIGERFKIYGHVETNLPAPDDTSGYYQSESFKPVACKAVCIWDYQYGDRPLQENWVSSEAGHLEVESVKHSEARDRTSAIAETRYRFKPVGASISLDFEGSVSMHIQENYVQFELQKSDGQVVVCKRWPHDDPQGSEAIHEQDVVYADLVAGQEYCIMLMARVSFGDQTDGRAYLKVTFSDDRSVSVPHTP